MRGFQGNTLLKRHIGITHITLFPDPHIPNQPSEFIALKKAPSTLGSVILWKK